MPDGKVRHYLLSLGLPVGGPKGRYLVSRGYDPEAAEVLERDLKEVARVGGLNQPRRRIGVGSTLWWPRLRHRMVLRSSWPRSG